MRFVMDENFLSSPFLSVHLSLSSYIYDLYFVLIMRSPHDLDSTLPISPTSNSVHFTFTSLVPHNLTSEVKRVGEGVWVFAAISDLCCDIDGYAQIPFNFPISNLSSNQTISYTAHLPPLHSLPHPSSLIPPPSSLIPLPPPSLPHPFSDILSSVFNTISNVCNSFIHVFSNTACSATDGFAETAAEGSYDAALWNCQILIGCSKEKLVWTIFDE